MSNFFARFCGHTDQIQDLKADLQHARAQRLDAEARLKRSTILREHAEQRLQEESRKNLTLRKQRDDLTELVQDQVDREQVIDLLINAKRVSGLNHSGPQLARERIDQAITLLREGK